MSTVLSRPRETLGTSRVDGTTLNTTAAARSPPERVEAADSGSGGGWWLVFGLSGVELGQGALRDPLQHLLREDPHQLPADVQGLKHAPVLVGTWTQQHNLICSKVPSR